MWRIYLSALDGSCKTPIGALANEKESNKKNLIISSTINGNKYIKDQTYFDIEDYRKMSFNLGKKIKKQLLHSEDSPYTTNKWFNQDCWYFEAIKYKISYSSFSGNKKI